VIVGCRESYRLAVEFAECPVNVWAIYFGLRAESDVGVILANRRCASKTRRERLRHLMWPKLRPMEPGKTCLERAFELARSGKFTEMGALERQLRNEGYQQTQLEGTSVRKQIRALMPRQSK